MKYTFVSVFFILLIGVNTTSVSAQNSWDFGSWNTLNVNYRLNKKLFVVMTQEARFKNNLSQLNLFYTNFGVEYRMNEYFRNSIVYRHIDKYINEANRFSFRNRIMWDMTLRYPINEKLAFSYRHRLQIENRNFNTSERGYLAEMYSRNRVAMKYDLSDRLSAEVSAEFRYQIHDPRNIESDGKWHRNRYMTGINYKATDALEWGAYYLIQNEYNVSLRENLSVVGLELNVDLNRLIKSVRPRADDIYLE